MAFIFSACSSENADIIPQPNDHDLSITRHAIIRHDVFTPFVKSESRAVASLYIQAHPDYHDQSVCSGTLITPKHILTAAHCVVDLSGKFALFSDSSSSSECDWMAGFVSAGTNDLFDYLKVGFGTTPYAVTQNLYDVKSVIYHSGYAHIADSNSCTETGYDGYEFTENDIAILELTEPVPESVASPIAPLPPWFAINQTQLDREEVFVTFAGYGYNNAGNKGYLATTRQKMKRYCEPKKNTRYCSYNESIHIKGCHPNPVTCSNEGELDYIAEKIAFPAKSFFYKQNYGGPCTGDSGGPALLYRGKRFYVAGITSYGDNTCTGYGISTAVQDYYDWILKNVPEVAQSYYEVCDNFVDDDHNGLIDHDDPACAGKPYCGDGIVNGDEFCDGNTFYDNSDECSSWSYNYASGKVTCTPECQINDDNCIKAEKPETCGNGIVEGDEHCDGTQFVTLFNELMESDSCSEFSAMFSDGKLTCNPNCTIETADCTFALEDYEGLCGNNTIDPGEYCDGYLFAKGVPELCSEHDPYFSDGKLLCDQCELDISHCEAKNICGDGKISGEENCDGDLFLLDTKECSDWSIRFKSGQLKCNRNCSIDFSECVLSDEVSGMCGNGQLEGRQDVNGYNILGEECDDDLFLHEKACSEWDTRYSEGKVSCESNCTANFKSCILDKANIYDEDYGMSLVLNHETKPDITAPIKPDDSVKFMRGDKKHKEDLTFGSLSDEPFSVDPDAPPKEPDSEQPVTPENPIQPKQPIPPAPNPPKDESSVSSCSASMLHTKNSLPVFLMLMCAGIGLRRKIRE